MAESSINALGLILSICGGLLVFLAAAYPWMRTAGRRLAAFCTILVLWVYLAFAFNALDGSDISAGALNILSVLAGALAVFAVSRFICKTRRRVRRAKRQSRPRAQFGRYAAESDPLLIPEADPANDPLPAAKSREKEIA